MVLSIFKGSKAYNWKDNLKICDNVLEKKTLPYYYKGQLNRIKIIAQKLPL